MEKIEVVNCETQEEAQALANLLWNEEARHMDDIKSIRQDLEALHLNWHVQPRKIRRFVKP